MLDQQDTHLCCGKTRLGVIEHGFDLMSFHSFKPFEEFLDRRAALQILEQRRDRHSRTLEKPGTADFSGNTLNLFACTPIDH